jgi:long-chain acyl-CoA synthetase
MNLAQLLVRAARTYPDRPAIYEGDELRFSYGQLAGRVSKLAGYLKNTLKLNEGDRVAVYMTNHVNYLEILYAAWWAGLSVVPINAKLHPKEVEYIVDDSQAEVMFVSDDLIEDMQPLMATKSFIKDVISPQSSTYQSAINSDPIEVAHANPDDLAWLFYTSGTTGKPKGVMQTHRNLYTMTACYFTDVDDVNPEDSIVYAAPMSHGAGLYNFAFVAKAAKHVVPKSGGFEPAELVELSKSVGHLCMFAAPTMVKRLVEHIQSKKSNSDGFKTIVYGGGPMYVQDIKLALEVMGPKFVQIYGQGESPMTITALSRGQIAGSQHPQWLERIASVGIAHTQVEVKVVNEDGFVLPHNQTGEIVVRGDTVMVGYWRNPESTAMTLKDGWLWTGDMGSQDEFGFVTLKDRSKDVIISGGSNVYPREVEEVLLQHPKVSEVSVVGQVDAEWGEIIIAFVVGAATPEELDALCLENMARFKRPKRYEYLESLPKNNYGKVLKTALRDRLKTS